MRGFLDEFKLIRGCAVCGYNKCAAALDFHHSDGDKTFNLGEGAGRSLRRIKKEMHKCDVLCRNCHAELHEKEKEEAKSS